MEMEMENVLLHYCVPTSVNYITCYQNEFLPLFLL